MDADDRVIPTAFLGKAHAEIADPQTLLASLIFKCFDMTYAGLSQSVNGRENVHGGLLRDGANVGFCLLGEEDSLHALWPLISSTARTGG